MGSCDYCSDLWARQAGRMTPTQRWAFLACLLVGIIGNCVYAGFAIAKVVDARANPVTSVSSEQWTDGHFPSFRVLLSPMYSFDSNTNRTQNGTLCPFVSGSCRAYHVNGRGTRIPIAFADAGIVYHPYDYVYVPASAWVWIYNPETFDRLDTQIELSLTVNRSSVDSGICTRVNARVYGNSLFPDNDGSGGFSVRAGVDLIIGNGAGIIIQASGKRTLYHGDDTIYEVRPVRAVDYGPLNPSRSGFGADAPYTVSIVMSTDEELTEDEVSIVVQSLSYDWTDAIGGIFAVFNLSLTAIALIFPVVPLVPHARLFVSDSDAYTADRERATKSHAAQSTDAASAVSAGAVSNQPLLSAAANNESVPGVKYT